MLSPQLGFTPWSVIDGFSITPLWLGLRLCSLSISPYKVFKSIICSYRSSHFLLPTSYFLLPTSYFLLPTSYFILHTSYFILLIDSHPFPYMCHLFAEPHRFIFRVIEVHACPRCASHTERLHERLCTVGARANCHMLAVKNACNVMRMHVVDGERDNTTVT